MNEIAGYLVLGTADRTVNEFPCLGNCFTELETNMQSEQPLTQPLQQSDGLPAWKGLSLAVEAKQMNPIDLNNSSATRRLVLLVNHGKSFCLKLV